MGLFNIKISISEKRNPKVQHVMISKNVKLSSWGAVYMSLVNADFFPSSFCLENGDCVIYIDPLKVESGRIANYVLITHGHPDHFSLEDIGELSDDNTVIICPKKVAKKLSGYKTEVVKPGEYLEYGDLNIETVNAYSIGFPSHSRGNENVGYVITIDGIRIYHAGDTDLIVEMEKLDGIDVLLVPIDGGNLTMSTQEAAKLTNMIKPRMVIPMHYVINARKADEFRQLVDEGIEVKILSD